MHPHCHDKNWGESVDCMEARLAAAEAETEWIHQLQQQQHRLQVQTGEALTARNEALETELNRVRKATVPP